MLVELDHLDSSVEVFLTLENWLLVNASVEDMIVLFVY